MSDPAPPTAARFIVEVQHVKEVTLVAEADLAYWQARLQADGLFPFNNNGKAELFISATDLRALGRHTNELTIGIAVCERDADGAQDGLYLVQAFNSSRLFAWVERTFFHTPYDHGRLMVAHQPPARIQLRDQHGLLVNLQMDAQALPAHGRDELWQGVIFLPRAQARRRPAKFFIAKLGGYTEVYPYSPATSTLQLTCRPAHPVFQWLRESNVVGTEWRIRRDALHARSKTFTRA